MPARLPKVGSTYYFRRAVPHELRPYFATETGKQRTEFMISLHEKDLAAAKSKWLAEAVRVDALLAEARRRLAAGVTPERAADLADWQAIHERDQFQASLQHSFEQDRIDAEEQEDDEALVKWLDRPLSELDREERTLRRNLSPELFEDKGLRARRQKQVEADWHDGALLVATATVGGGLGRVSFANSTRFTDLFAAYADEAALELATKKRWEPVFRHLEAHLGHDDAGRVSRSDLIAWKDALRSELGPDGQPLRQPRTIREVYLASVKATYAWAVQNGKLEHNPAESVSIRVPKKVRLRSPDLSEAEASLILRNSLLPQSDNISAEHALARRWVPWICAYHGARVNEITQIDAQDVQQIGGIWTLRITPERGSQKSKEARTIPLHPHLVEQGFPDVARRKGAGPLFYDPARGRGGSGAHPHSKKVGERLAEWVRKIGVTDPDVQPNHGWRHLFKTRAKNAGVDPDAREAIPGHAPGTEGRKYGVNDIPFLARETAKLPRFDIEGS